MEGAERHIEWDLAATQRLDQVPAGFLREMVRQRVEKRARDRGAEAVTAEDFGSKMQKWAATSSTIERALPWDDAANARLARVPESIRGMVMLEVEREARRAGEVHVTSETLERAMKRWAETHRFHSEG